MLRTKPETGTAQSANWTAEEGQHGWRLRYDPAPDGIKNTDGSTTYSVSFPALELTDYVADPENIAKVIAVELNAFDDLLSSLKAITTALRDGYSPNRQKLEAAEAAIARADGRQP